jgi:hypothetical protein
MLWAIYCVDRPNTASLREQHMRPHRVYLDEETALLVLGGATLSDDAFLANWRARFRGPCLLVVVSWAMLLFCGFGVFSGLNSTSVGALAFGSFAVASAIFLILELSQPHTGLSRIPAASTEQTLAALSGSPT